MADIIGPYGAPPREDARLTPDGPASLEDVAPPRREAEPPSTQAEVVPPTLAPEGAQSSSRQSPTAPPTQGAAGGTTPPHTPPPGPQPVPGGAQGQTLVVEPVPGAGSRTWTAWLVGIVVAVVVLGMAAALVAFMVNRGKPGPIQVHLLQVGTGQTEGEETISVTGAARSFPAGTKELYIAYQIGAPGTRPARPRLEVYRDGERQVHWTTEMEPLAPNALVGAVQRVTENPQFTPGAYEIRIYNGKQLVETYEFTVRAK